MKVRFSDKAVKRNRDPLFERGNWTFHLSPGCSFTVHNMKKKDAINYALGGPLNGCTFFVAPAH